MYVNASDLSAIARGAFSISPDDDADLAQPARGLYVGTTGDVKATMADGTTVTMVGMAAGVVHPIHVVRVHDTGTTADDLVGML